MLSKRSSGGLFLFIGLAGLLVYSNLAVARHNGPEPQPPEVSFAQLSNAITRNCGRCHFEGTSATDAFDTLALDDLISSEDRALGADSTWKRVYSRVIVTRSMPPRGSGPEMPDSDRGLIRNWIDQRFKAGSNDSRAQPSSLRRLSNYEYNNSVRDLFGFDFNVDTYIQKDNAFGGFNNNVAVVFSTPDRVRQYSAASQFVAETVLGLNDKLVHKRRRWEAPAILAENPNRRYWSAIGRRLQDMIDGVKASQRAANSPNLDLTNAREANGKKVRALELERNSRFALLHVFPISGSYTLEIHATPQNSRKAATIDIDVDGVPLTIHLDVAAGATTLRSYKVEFHPPQGKRSIRFSVPATKEPVLLSSVEIAGPVIAGESLAGATNLLASRLACVEPDTSIPGGARDCAARTVRQLAVRAFRTAGIDDARLETLLIPFHQAMDNGADFRTALGMSIQTVLVDPQFIYRIESVRPDKGDLRLNDFELATRLSYLVWGSLPDDQLRRLASTGALANSPGAIRAELRRMLADPRSDALIRAFAEGWLGYGSLRGHVVDTRTNAEFDEPLRQAMLTETELYLKAFFDENWRIPDLIDSKAMFVNERLARHYGIDNLKGGEFRRIESPREERRGLITQGSILTTTSSSNRTSVVKRGFWVLNKILCEPIGDPPANVPALEESAVQGMTLRQEMERHRADPTCAGCHKKMDPPGFSLENYDATGRWRTMDDGAAIDPSGTLPGAAGSFKTFAELRDLLKRDPRVPVCVTRTLMTYAFGRSLQEEDEATVRDIAAKTEAGGHRIQDVIAEIVLSAPFRERAH